MMENVRRLLLDHKVGIFIANECLSSQTDGCITRNAWLGKLSRSQL